MDYKLDYIKFQNEVKRRGIQFLVHFTETINLLSILEHKKIYSRAQLENLKIEHQDLLDFIEFNDTLRLDELKNYINLSLSFPNYFLFNKFREKMNHVYINWCILKINPCYIYANETLFSVSNAASNASRYQYKITGDYQKFLMLFKDQLSLSSFNGTKVVNRSNINDQYTTDVQAEVLVKDQIEYADIIEICFPDKETLASAKAACIDYDTSKFIIDPIVFTSIRK